MLLTVLFAMLVWWSGTGLVMLLVRGPAHSRVGQLAALAVLGISLGAVDASLGTASVAATVTGFLAAVVIWGVLEYAHLAGWLTGPEKRVCPPELAGWQRFWRALQVGLYHDLAILVLVGLLWLVVAGQPNPVAAWTFTVLWVMRWSAKLNLYLGVANFDQRLVPERMRYMGSYMRRRELNGLFPLSILAGLGLVWLALSVAGQPGTEPYLRTGGVLAGTLAALGVLEHVLMMLPLRDSRLWQWVMPDRLNHVEGS